MGKFGQDIGGGRSNQQQCGAIGQCDMGRFPFSGPFKNAAHDGIA